VLAIHLHWKIESALCEKGRGKKEPELADFAPQFSLASIENGSTPCDATLSLETSVRVGEEAATLPQSPEGKISTT
jgi:hypothetical protein